MRWSIAVVLVLGCSGQAAPEPSPPRSGTAAGSARPVVALDGPRLGLYRLDTEELRPRLTELFGDAVEEVSGTRAWLILDRDMPPAAILSVEPLDLDLEPLRLTRHLTHFELAWVEHSDRPALECRAESAEQIGCSIAADGHTPVRFRLRAVGGVAAPGLPAPGIYRQVVASASTDRARLGRWLADNGVAAAERRSLLSRLSARSPMGLIDGDVLLEIEPRVSVPPAGAGDEPPEVSLDLAVFERRLEPRPGGFRARRSEARDTFFDCEIAGDRGEIRCRDGDARWRYIPKAQRGSADSSR
jgi:hypothetical protein